MQDQILEALKTIFQDKGLATEAIKNGFGIDLAALGLPCLSADFYSLSGKPGHIRAKIRGDANRPPLEPADLELIQQSLQNHMGDAALLEAFNYFGCRDEAHVYYAHIAEKEAAEPEGLKIAVSPATDAGTLHKAAQIALKQLEALDSSSLRRNLDQLGLPRSSVVRLSLTRIFRDSMNAEELLANVAEEAIKIVKMNEWELLKKAKVTIKEQVPALNNVVQLLWLCVYQDYMRRAEKGDESL